MSNPIGRPKVLGDSKTFLKVALPGDLREALQHESKITGASEAEIIRRSLRKFLGV